MLDEKTQKIFCKKLDKCIKRGITEQELVDQYLDAITFIQKYFEGKNHD